MWPIGSSSCSQNLNSKAFSSLEKQSIGALKTDKKKEKKKDNQYKLNQAMAIAMGLTHQEKCNAFMRDNHDNTLNL